MHEYITTVHQTGEVFKPPRDVENTGCPWGLRETHIIGGFAAAKGGQAQVVSCIMAVWSRDRLENASTIPSDPLDEQETD